MAPISSASLWAQTNRQILRHLGPRWALGIGVGAGFAAALVAVYVLTRREKLLHAQYLA